LIPLRERRSSRRIACPATATPASNLEFGAPNLTDQIWLYGSDEATIVETITNGRSGVMPAWVGRLDPATIKALAVYVHTLGGGK
jgi:cytochrome c oxidase cbb3-type subunit 3